MPPVLLMVDVILMILLDICVQLEQEIRILHETIAEIEAERNSLDKECKKLKNQVEELIHVKEVNLLSSCLFLGSTQ